MTPPIAPFPCPICDAPPHRREHLRGAELCNGCGNGIILNEQGELVAWFVTQKTKPPKKTTTAAWLVVAVLNAASCAPVVPPLTPPPASSRIVIRETLSETEEICVVRDPFRDPRLVCMTVGQLRRTIRGRGAAYLEAP